jgi:para-nitrobenzyl esterase
MGVDRANGWSIIDGYVVPDALMSVFSRREQNDVPLLTGATADEGSTQPPTTSIAEFKRRAQSEYGDLAELFLKLFPAETPEQVIESSRRAVGTRVFNWENWAWANMQAQNGTQPVYFYYFAQVPPKPILPGGGDLSRDIGAFHTAEIPYVFGTLNSRTWPWTERDRKLSGILGDYWVNFARTGDPNGCGLPQWPRYDRNAPSTLSVRDGEIQVTDVPDRDTLDCWQLIDEKIRAGMAA